EGVKDMGGLYVLGTERHESRRIDNQLRGRSGRQGDPGETRFYLSAQDEVIHFVNRKNVVKYDDVLNEQRKEVYARRQEILRGDDIREGIMQWTWDVIEAAISAHADGDYAENWEWDEMWVALHSVYPVRVPISEMREQAPSQEELTEIIYHDAVEYYEQ